MGGDTSAFRMAALRTRAPHCAGHQIQYGLCRLTPSARKEAAVKRRRRGDADPRTQTLHEPHRPNHSLPEPCRRPRCSVINFTSQIRAVVNNFTSNFVSDVAGGVNNFTSQTGSVSRFTSQVSTTLVPCMVHVRGSKLVDTSTPAKPRFDATPTSSVNNFSSKPWK